LGCNFQLNRKNGLKIKPFKKALKHRQDDKELFYLTKYLLMIAHSEPDFAKLDHSSWKEYIISKLWEAQMEYKQLPAPVISNRLSVLLPAVQDMNVFTADDDEDDEDT